MGYGQEQDQEKPIITSAFIFKTCHFLNCSLCPYLITNKDYDDTVLSPLSVEPRNSATINVANGMKFNAVFSTLTVFV
jgi:hypothetical protein